MPTLVQPYPMRSNVSEEAGTLRISIPMQRNWFVMTFVVCWLGAWTYGGLQVFKHLLTNFELFSAFWMGGWAVGEVFVIFWVCRMVGGRDIVRASAQTLDVRKEVFGVGMSKQYIGAEIRDLRFQAESGSGKTHRVSRLAFDYGAKTVRFGDGLDEAEANQLISLIEGRCQIPNSYTDEASELKFWQGR